MLRELGQGDKNKGKAGDDRLRNTACILAARRLMERRLRNRRAGLPGRHVVPQAEAHARSLLGSVPVVVRHPAVSASCVCGRAARSYGGSGCPPAAAVIVRYIGSVASSYMPCAIPSMILTSASLPSAESDSFNNRTAPSR